MAAIIELGTRNFVTTGGTTTLTATPTLNDLIVVVCMAVGVAGGTTAVSDNNSGGAGTYTKAGTSATGPVANQLIDVWVRNALIASASSTVFKATQVGSTGGGLGVFRVSGMTKTGSTAMRGFGKQDSAGPGTPTPILLPMGGGGAQAALTTNPLIGAVCRDSNPPSLTPRASPAWTEAFDVGFNSPSSGIEVMWISSGETASSIAWGSSSAGTFGAFAFELDASAGATPTSLLWTPQLTVPTVYIR